MFAVPVYLLPSHDLRFRKKCPGGCSMHACISYKTKKALYHFWYRAKILFLTFTLYARLLNRPPDQL